MTGLFVAALIIGMIVIVGAATMFMLLPVLLAAVGILVLVAVMAVAAVLLIPNFVTLDDFKPQILSALEKATGREISIGGQIGFTVWPVLGLQLNDISVGNPEGYRDPIMISAKQIGIGMTLSSLMEHKLDLRELKLVGAQINLGVAENGRGNWMFELNKHAATENAASADSQAPEREPFVIKDINIHAIRIEDADISYDRAGVTVAEVDNINLTFRMPGLDAAASGEGSFEYGGRKVSLTGELENPRAVTEERASPVSLGLTIGSDKLSLDGTLNRSDFDGQLQLVVARLPDIISWASGKPASLPFTEFSMTSRIKASPLSVSFTDMAAKLDDVAVSGEATMALAGARPKLTADLDVGRLDLNRFAGGTEVAGGNSPSRGEPAAPDLSGLQAVNADVTARLAGLLVKNLEIGGSTARIQLQGGRLQASLSPASFYGGTLTARADVSAGNRSFSGSATLDGVNIEPVLIALNGSARLSGKGDFTVNVSGPVSTPAAIKAALDGDGRFAFRDGAIKGVNIPAIIRRAKSMLGAATPAEPEGLQQTDFTELSGTFTIHDGVVSNNDLKMLSPMVRVTGRGTFAIPAQEVNYRVDGALVADLTGQGGLLDRKGLVIPINVRGTLGNLSYTPDVEGLVLGNVGNARQLGESLQNLNSKDGQRATRNAIKDMLGIPRPPEAEAAPAPVDGSPASQPAPQEETASAPAAPPPPAQPKPEDVLRGLLGGQ